MPYARSTARSPPLGGTDIKIDTRGDVKSPRASDSSFWLPSPDESDRFRGNKVRNHRIGNGPTLASQRDMFGISGQQAICRMFGNGIGKEFMGIKTRHLLEQPDL